MKKERLIAVNIVAMLMMLSEGSWWCWANVVGVIMWGMSARELGFFKN